MLELIWYSILLLLQVVQVDPKIDVTRLELEVFVESSLVYSLKVQGSLVQGQIVSSENRSVLGEFESSRRVPQTYLIFPRQALPEQLGKEDGEASIPNSFNLDFTKALKILRPFSTNRVQRLSLDLLPLIEDGESSKKSSTTTSIKPQAATSSTNPAANATDDKAKNDYGLEIRSSAQRLVLTVPSAGLLVILSYR